MVRFYLRPLENSYRSHAMSLLSGVESELRILFHVNPDIIGALGIYIVFSNSKVNLAGYSQQINGCL